MKRLTKLSLLLFGICMAIGLISTGDGIAKEFSFIDCNELIPQEKLSQILNNETIFVEDASADTVKKSSKPMEFGKPLKKSTDALAGSAECEYAGPPKKGNDFTAGLPIFSGTISVMTSSAKTQFELLASKNSSVNKQLNITILEESKEIGKATIVNKLPIPGIGGETLSVYFLDDEVDAMVYISINEWKSSKPLENVIQKLKGIAMVVEKNIK